MNENKRDTVIHSCDHATIVFRQRLKKLALDSASKPFSLLLDSGRCVTINLVRHDGLDQNCFCRRKSLSELSKIFAHFPRPKYAPLFRRNSAVCGHLKGYLNRKEPFPAQLAEALIDITGMQNYYLSSGAVPMLQTKWQQVMRRWNYQTFLNSMCVKSLIGKVFSDEEIGSLTDSQGIAIFYLEAN